MKNPLRYPGGKSFLAEYIAQVLECNELSGCTFYEPYAGSAAVSLEMLSRGLVGEVVLIERDPLVYSFWESVVSWPDELCDRISEIEPSLETWESLLLYRKVTTPLEYPTLDLGVAGLFFNRTNYSGILGAGPIGGRSQSSQYNIGCRFNRDTIVNSIKEIAKFKDQITVRWDDALAYLRLYRRQLTESACFVYADPPYYAERGKRLYRYHYRDSDHRNLAALLRSCTFPWLISYDDHPFISELYVSEEEQLSLQRLYLDYSVRNHKRCSELLISNLELPPVKRMKRVEFEVVSGR